jgi:hypothetical protein
MAEVHLFAHPNFEGPPLIKTNNDPNLNDNEHFGNMVSAVIVKSGTFTLYTGPNYTGHSVTVCKTGGPKSDGEYPTDQWLGGKNDAIDSVKKNSDHPM